MVAPISTAICYFCVVITTGGRPMFPIGRWIVVIGHVVFCTFQTFRPMFYGFADDQLIVLRSLLRMSTISMVPCVRRYIGVQRQWSCCRVLIGRTKRKIQMRFESCRERDVMVKTEKCRSPCDSDGLRLTPGVMWMANAVVQQLKRWISMLCFYPLLRRVPRHHQMGFEKALYI